VELREPARAPADQEHLDVQPPRRLVGRDATEHGDAAAGAGRLGAAPQDRDGLAVGPVVQHVPDHVEIGAGGKRVEEVLAREAEASGDVRRAVDLRGARDGAGQVDERAAHAGVQPQELGEHGAGAAADVDDMLDAVPAVRELQPGVRRAVTARPDHVVEAGREARMGRQVLPERDSVLLRVRRLAGAHPVRQRAPGAREPAADPVEIEERRRVADAVGRGVEREAAGLRLGEDPAGHEVREHGVQRPLVAGRRAGERPDLRHARRDPVGDP